MLKEACMQKVKTLLSAVIIAIVTCGTAMAESYGKFHNGDGYSTMYVWAKITSVHPDYKTVTTSTPQQVCKTVEVPIYGSKDATGEMIIGGIIGGIIGNQIGSGSGKNVATGVGALTGAIAGKNHSEQHQTIVGYRQVQKCETHYNQTTSQKQIVGYKFGYRIHPSAPNGRGYSKNFIAVGDKVKVKITTQVVK